MRTDAEQGIENLRAHWPNALDIPRVHKPTAKQVEALVHSSTPAIFTGIEFPTTIAEGTVEALLARAPDAVVKACVNMPPIGPELEAYSVDNVAEMPFHEYVELMNDPQRKRPCYTVDTPASIFGFSDLNVLEQLHPSLKSGGLFIGTSGASIGLHTHRQAWVAVLAGEKDVFLVRRQYSKYLDPVPMTPTWSRLDPMNPDFERHPERKKVIPFIARLKPGDILFIPDFVWHCLWPAGDCISLHGRWDSLVRVPRADPYDWRDFVVQMPGTFGWRQSAEILRQAIWYGALGKPPESLNAIPGFRHPFGVFVWDQIKRDPVGEVDDLALTGSRNNPKS